MMMIFLELLLFFFNCVYMQSSMTNKKLRRDFWEGGRFTGERDPKDKAC